VRLLVPTKREQKAPSKGGARQTDIKMLMGQKKLVENGQFGTMLPMGKLSDAGTKLLYN
jgi:hypothetical protein